MDTPLRNPENLFGGEGIYRKGGRNEKRKIYFNQTILNLALLFCKQKLNLITNSIRIQKVNIDMI